MAGLFVLYRLHTESELHGDALAGGAEGGVDDLHAVQHLPGLDDELFGPGENSGQIVVEGMPVSAGGPACVELLEAVDAVAGLIPEDHLEILEGLGGNIHACRSYTKQSFVLRSHLWDLLQIPYRYKIYYQN